MATWGEGLTTWQKIGSVAAILGGIVFTVTLAVSLLDIGDAPSDCPPKSLPAEMKAAFYVDSKTEFGLNRTLCLAVNRKAYFGDPKPGAPQTVRLFVDDVRTPVTIDLYADGKDEWSWKSLLLAAPPDANSEDAKIWRSLLSHMPLAGIRKVRLGLGDGDARLPRVLLVEPVPLRAYQVWRLALGCLGLLLLAGGVVVASWNTGLLREPPADPTDKETPPFSLGRTQMGWWLVVVTGSFLFIWLVTGQFLHVLNTGALTLLGIAGATGLSAAVIGPGKKAASRGFFLDLLSDGGALALHRVQMVAWTLILGLLFVWSVLTSFAFPDFESGRLVMAGIANGVYLGFKFPEQSK